MRAAFDRLVDLAILFSRFAWAGAVPVLAWIAGALCLLLPQQTEDLLTQSTPVQRYPLFWLGVAVWAVTCWYWARWGINLQPARPPERPRAPALPAAVMDRLVQPQHVTLAAARLRCWLPRLLLFLSPLVAFVSALRSEEAFSDDWWPMFWANLGCFLLLEAALAAPIVAKHYRPGMLRARLVNPSAPSEKGTFRLSTCFERLPFCGFSWLLWLVLFAVLSIESAVDPVGLADQFGTPAITFLGLSAFTGITAFATVLIRRFTGVPGLLVVIAWAMLVSQFNHNHLVRTIAAQPLLKDQQPAGLAGDGLHADVRARPTLDEAFQAWRATCPDNPAQPDIVLVATAGGASRAALWTASVLNAVEQALPPGRFRHALFAISGVSGGSLGGAAYVAALPPAGCRAAESLEERDVRWDRTNRALRTNFLPAPLASFLLSDVLSRIVPLPLPDRATALEVAWEQAWRRQWDSTSKIAPSAYFDQSLLALWMSRTAPGATPLGATRPLLFFNGTHANSGLPAVTAPVKINRDNFPLALDVLDVLDRDIRLSSAVSNSARFPIVSPGGTLLDRDGRYMGDVMDGGYVENFGADTVRDLIADINYLHPGKSCQPNCDKPRVLVIQISTDPDLDPAIIPRCATQTPASPLPFGQVTRPVQALSDLLGPITTVVQARGARGARAAGDLMRTKCKSRVGDGDDEYVHFALCDQDIPGAGRQADVIGLNWALTEKAVQFLAPLPPRSTPGDPKPAPAPYTIPAGSAMAACGNPAQLDALINWFKSKPSPRGASDANGTIGQQSRQNGRRDRDEAENTPPGPRAAAVRIADDHVNDM